MTIAGTQPPDRHGQIPKERQLDHLAEYTHPDAIPGHRRIVRPRQIVTGALSGIERYQLPDAIREDYLSSYDGDRMVESMRYVRGYPAELPVLRDLLGRPGRWARLARCSRDLGSGR
jgi:hypothetical protein